MSQGIARRILIGIAVITTAAVLAPAASASITPTVTLDQSGGTQAGSTAPLGMDLKFAPTGMDSPKDLTLTLPPGLLSDASVDGGACLQTTAPTPACQVGSGTVTVLPLGAPLPLSQPVAYDLVAPPHPGDLAGLVLLVNGAQSGSPGEVTVRPASAPAGFGLNISFNDIPDTYQSVPISVDEIKSTFAGLRLPTSCPSTPANIGVTADSYSDSTPRTASAPLQVTGCSSLPFSPTFKVTAIKDAADSGVQVVTDLTQPAAPAQATGRTVKLTFPAGVFVPNVAAVLNGGILCTDPSFATCKPIGTVRSASPLYPATLTGKAYLTGTLTAPAIALVFPPPFALTLAGNVNLATNSTTFTNVPDIPLTDLQVTLTGGSDSVFNASCNPSSGTASSTLTTQDGDRTVVASAPFSVTGCPPPTGNGGPPPPPPPPGGGTPPPKPPKPPVAGPPQLTSASLSGLAHGLPVLTFRLVAGNNAPKLRSFAIQLPRGLAFSRAGLHKRHAITISGARIKSARLQNGRLVIVLSQPVKSVLVRIGPQALTEAVRLERRARHHRLGHPKLAVVITDAAGARTVAVLQLKLGRR